MKTSPAPVPAPRTAAPRACTLTVSRAELDAALGAPFEHEAGGALGPRLRWEHVWGCGLAVVLELPATRESGLQEARVGMSHLEVEHLLAHLGLTHERVSWRADLLEPLSLEGWAVVRRDTHGHRFDLCVLSVREHAECMARQMEVRAPHRTFDVELRGSPPSHDRAGRATNEHRSRFEAAPDCFVSG